MSRIRYVKPEFFLHEGLAELSPMHRLCFIGLWTLADRDGRLEDRPKRIKAALFPYDDFDLDAMLSELDEAEFIQRYEVNGGSFIAIPGFAKHQRPHPKETSNNLPDPPSREKKRQAVKKNGKDGKVDGPSTASREKVFMVDGPSGKVGEPTISCREKIDPCRVENGDGDLNGEGFPSAAPPAEAQGRHAATMALFVRLWAELRGGIYRPAGGKDGAAVKRLLTYPEATDAEVEARMRHAFADGWFREHGDLTNFVSQWSKWQKPTTPAPQQEQRRDGEWQAEKLIKWPKGKPFYPDPITGESNGL